MKSLWDCPLFDPQLLERMLRAFLEVRAAGDGNMTPYIYRPPEVVHLRSFINDTDLSHHRWILDTEDDFRFVTNICEALYTRDNPFKTDAVFELFQRRPELARTAIR